MNAVISSQNGAISRPNLGSNGRNSASNERRGLQPFQEVEKTEHKRFESVDENTGEITVFEETKKGQRVYRTSQEGRAERYALKSVVNKIFPSSMTAKCSRMVIPHASVKVLKSVELNKAHYKGLTRCASVWWCPCCAAKISERRRGELETAVSTAKAKGWQVFLMTCTIPHGMGDDLQGTLTKMLKAWKGMMNNRAGQKLKKLLGVEGVIRAFEITDGANGFHPHFHALVFAQPKFTIESFQSGFLPLWQDYCVKAGLPRPSDERGLRVDDGSWASKYASKWGLEDEMTRGHSKTSKGDKGMTPWDMLRDVLKNDSERSRKRFYIYALAFKGKRQLHWSVGLKDKLAIEIMTDEEAVAKEEEKSVEVAELTTEQWRAVMFSRCESSLLDMAEDRPGDIPAFLSALVSIHKAYTFVGPAPPP